MNATKNDTVTGLELSRSDGSDSSSISHKTIIRADAALTALREAAMALLQQIYEA